MSSTSRPDGAETSSGCPSHFPLNQSAQARTPQPDGRRRLKLLLKVNRRLSTAYLLKEEFGQLGNYEREGLGSSLLRELTQVAAPEALREVRRDDDRHWDGITAYCRRTRSPRDSSKGVNTKIRVIQRRSYGLRDEEYLRLKILTYMLDPI